MKLALLDRDGTLNYASGDSGSPLYRVTKPENVIIKPGVVEALRLLEIHGWEFVLVTKQRSQALDQIAHINQVVRLRCGVKFVDMFVEYEADNKAALYRCINDRWDFHKILFDDSPEERRIAQSMGIEAYDGLNLLESVESFLNVR